MLSPIRIGLFARVLPFLLAALGVSAQTRPEPLPPLDSLGYEALNAISIALFEQAERLKPVFAGLNEQASEGLLSRQAHLDEAKADSTVSKLQLDSLTKAVKAAKSLAKKRTQQLDRAEKALLFSGGIREMTDSLLIRKSLPKAWQQITQLYDELYPPIPVAKVENEDENAAQPPIKKEKKKKGTAPESAKVSDNASNTVPQTDNKPGPDAPNTNQLTLQSKQFARYNPARDVMLSPPTPPCSIASSSRDEFSGEVSRELSRAELFRFTNPALKNYLKGKAHVICEAALASTGPNAMLILTFNINDPNARKAFGRLEKNSMASLKFLDGNVLELRNSVADDGVFALENETSIFRGQYPLTPEVFKKIRKSELDTIRILWSKGYDDYEVQQVDLLMRQAECLFK
jgi:hypothetical protein